MENKIIKFANYTLIGFVVLISINILSEIVPTNPCRLLRQILAVINYFIFIPIFLLSIYFSIVVLLGYISVKFKQPIKHFFFVLPFLIYFVIYISMFIYAVFIKEY